MGLALSLSFSIGFLKSSWLFLFVSFFYQFSPFSSLPNMSNLDFSVVELIDKVMLLNCQETILHLTTTQITDDPFRKLILVGKLINQRRFNVQIIKAAVTKLWRPQHDLIVTASKQNTFIFQFNDSEDLHQAWKNRPWLVQNHHLYLQQWPSDITFDDIIFTSSLFWIQIHDLPPNQFNLTNAITIGNTIGRFLEAEKEQLTQPNSNTFLRIKADVDINKHFLLCFFN